MKIFTELTNIEAKLINGGCACSCKNRKTPLMVIVIQDGYEVETRAEDYKFIGLVRTEEICRISCAAEFLHHSCGNLGGAFEDASISYKSESSEPSE